MTKVLFIAHSTFPGGSTIALQRLVSGLIDDGIQATIVYPAFSNPQYEKIFVDDFRRLGCTCISCFITPLYIKQSNLNGLKGKLYRRYISVKQYFGYSRLLKMVEEIKPDIIHTNSGVVQEGIKVANTLGIPHVWHIREYQTLDFNWELFPSEIEVRKLYNSSYTICITRGVQNYFGLNDSLKSRVIYDPQFSINTLSPAIQKKENYFLVANRISKEKGVEAVIKVFSLFIHQKPNFQLIIAGSGDKDYVDSLKTMCKSLNIDNNVVFKGHVQDVAPLMKCAYALLVGSYNEGFGMMTAEANMQGCLVIGRNTAGTKEIIENTNGGFLFNDENELLDYMNQVTDMNQDCIASFMEQPMIRARNLFSKEASCKQVLSYYQSILSGNER